MAHADRDGHDVDFSANDKIQVPETFFDIRRVN